MFGFVILLHAVGWGTLFLVVTPQHFDLGDIVACEGTLFKTRTGELTVQASQVRLLRGDAADSAGECRDYDAAIAAAGGIDLAILGLGANGHIAFNEPGADWNCRTHVARLTAQTRAAGGGGSADGVPALGITMGIATLREATQVLLLVAGDSKRAALAAFGAGRALPEWPVTALLDHPRLTVVCDRSLRTPP